MYILYLDESGNPDDWSQNHSFVLAGVAVFEGEIRGLGQGIDDIQKTILPHATVPIPFHAVDIYKGKDRWRRDSVSLRTKLMNSLYTTISNQTYPGVVLFGVAVHESAPQPGGADPLRLAFAEICGRFNQFLVRMKRGGPPQKGLLIVDPSGREKRYRELARTFSQTGVRLGYLGNLPDIPYFTHLGDTRMMQISDFIAYAVFQYYEHGFDGFLNQILERFDWPDRASARRPVGLCHMTRNPPASTCRCPATHAML